MDAVFRLLITQALFGRITGVVGQITGPFGHMADESDKLRALFTGLVGQITGRYPQKSGQ